MSDIDVLQASLIGMRDDNEDAESILINMDSKGNAIDKAYAPINIFVLCDGHGGKKVAILICNFLLRNFANRANTYPLSREVVNKICEQTQMKLSKRPDNVADGCGSTALITIMYQLNGEKYIQILNAGDCRAVLSKKGMAIALTKDHKPDWPDEKIRILEVSKKHNLNSKIEYFGDAWRIGDLSVSRAFGDLDNVPYVTHIPEIFSYKLNQYSEFIIMACDGLWDVISNEEAVNFVKDHRTDNQTFTYNAYMKNTKGKNIAEKLAQYAINKGSTDNVSVILIFLTI